MARGKSKYSEKTLSECHCDHMRMTPGVQLVVTHTENMPQWRVNVDFSTNPVERDLMEDQKEEFRVSLTGFGSIQL